MAAKDIWKPASIRLSGRISRITSAAAASARRLIAGRSTMIAIRAAAAITKARWVATEAPDSAR